MLSVTVIGGGITGLASSYFLHKSMPGADINLYESSGRLGGKVLSNRIGPAVAEAGPDSVVARNSTLTDLCRDIGLSDDIIYPETSKSYLWARGKLRPIPEGIFAGYPSKGLSALRRSGVLTLPGYLRVALETLLPRTRITDDISVGELTRRRFGIEFKNKLVDPLIGGIMSCSSDHLSASEVLPGLYSLAKENRSILSTAGHRLSSAPSPPFFSFAGGIGELVEKLDSATTDVRKHTGKAVVSMTTDGTKWKIRGTDFETVSDAVIQTAPAYEASSMLGPSVPELSSLLSRFRYTTVCNVVFAYRSGDVDTSIGGSGFLVPEDEGLIMTGCSWLSSKWANAQAEGLTLIRCFAGTPDSVSWQKLGDDRLADTLEKELRGIMNIRGDRLEYRVTRWEKALPQYSVGHRELVARCRSLSPPGLYLAGAAYGGVGISSCVADAKRAADSVSAYLASLA